MTGTKRIIQLLALIGLAAPAAAQERAAAPVGTLRGFVVDSIRGGPLQGATVAVQGIQGLAFTDSLGEYQIGNIPPGEYRVALFDALLDTLGITVLSHPARFAGGDTVELNLAIPSPRTIIAAKCGPAQGMESAAFGQVRDAVTGDPIAGARVILGWVELAVSRETGFRHDPKQRVAVSDAEGQYRICGLPAGLTADAYAEIGGKRTGYVQLAFGGSAMATATFLIPPTPPLASGASPTDSARARAGASSVRGVVTDETGKPVAGAHVSIAEGSSAAVTDPGGRFALDGQPAGTQALLVRRLGYLPAQVTVNLTPSVSRVVSVSLGRHVPVLEDVRVQARGDAALAEVGFTRRKRQGAGQYLERADIERRNALRLEHLFSGIRGLRVVGDEVRGQPEGAGYRCVRFFIDGQQWRGGPPGDFVLPSEVAAIEVYSRTMAPGEFQSFGDCETVVIWTKWRLRR